MKKLDMPRIGEVRFCTEKNAHVLIKDLILGNGVCDAVVYYIRDKKTAQVPTAFLKKNVAENTRLETARVAPGLHPSFSNTFKRKVKYQPQTTWDEVSMGDNLKKYMDTTKKCSCDMVALMRYGCKCGGA